MSLLQGIAQTGDFTMSLHKGLVRDKSLNPDGQANTFVSGPNHQALWLATAAATSGETRSEILNAAGFSKDAVTGTMDQQIGFAQAVNELRASVTEPNLLRIGSSLWAQEGWNVRADTAHFLRETLGAQAHTVNFVSDAEAARSAYNAWGARMTDDMIKEALQPGTVDGRTRLILGNALLLGAKWEEAFAKGVTNEGAFFLANGKAVIHDNLMRKTSANTHLFVSRQDGITVGKLPYKGGDLSMIVVTTTDPRAFADLEKNLSHQQLQDWVARARVIPDLDVKMPKFKLTTNVTLNDVYKALGIQAAYDETRADFSGIFEGLRPGTLHISSTISAAAVQNDEDGTKVAEVVTNMAFTESMVSPPSLDLNKPFLYIITSEKYGPIGIGRYVKPE